MEEVLAGHPDVAECAVIGIADALKGQVPLGFVVLKAGVDARHRRDRERSRRRWCASGSARSPRFKTVVTIKRLPKTRSGKILRGTMQKIADRRRMDDAGDDRRSGDPRRDHGGAEGKWIRSVRRQSLRTPANQGVAAAKRRLPVAVMEFQTPSTWYPGFASVV